MTSFLFTAVHQGPYLSIKPLEAGLGSENVSYLLAGVSGEQQARQGLQHWNLDSVKQEWGSLEQFLAQTGVQAVIRSTSEDVVETNVEAMASAAAQRLGIAVFVVEDFPGNHWPNPQERLDGLFIEDTSLAELHRSRGVDPEVIHATGNPRYDDLAKIDHSAKRRTVRSALDLAGQQVMLWAGQPDGDNSYLALERLLGHYRGREATILFRAHPRDGLYLSGKYDKLLCNPALTIRDVSSYPDVLDLYCASDLVATQFSSAAVEASHLGVPSLFVLFEDLGRQYLDTHKGYSLPPWCRDGCSFLIEEESDIQSVMEQALWDDSHRMMIQANFQQRFGTRGQGNTTISSNISKIILKRIRNTSPTAA